jgi:hypothetical protein
LMPPRYHSKKVQPPPPKLIYIVGCNHALQVPRDSPAEYEQQIEEYRRELRALASKDTARTAGAIIAGYGSAAGIHIARL